jgi:ubiquinol-cytochrome c reductase cytochrome b subunit
MRQAISRFYFQDRVEPVTPSELAAAHHDHHEPAALPEEQAHEALTSRD